MRTKTLLLIISLFLTMVLFVSKDTKAQAVEASDQTQEIVESILDSKEVEELMYSTEGFLEGLDDEIKGYMPVFNIKEMIKTGSGSVFDIKSLSSKFLGLFFKDIKANISLLGQLLILSALTIGFGAFVSNGSKELAETLTRVAAIGLGIASFRYTVTLLIKAADNMVNFVQALIPAMTGTMMATGAFSSAGVLGPLLLSLSTVVATIVKTAVIPLCLISFALKIINSVTGGAQLAKLSKLFQTFSTSILGLTGTLFVGILGIRGGFTSVADALTAKTAKFLSGSFIPVVGKIFADAIDLVAASSLLIKGALGTFGLVAIITMTLFPIIKILSVMLIYRVSAALSEPLGEMKISSLLTDIADTLSYLLVALGVVALMFFVSIAVLTGIKGVL